MGQVVELKRARILIGLLAASVCASAQTPDPWKYLPAESQSITVMDWTKVLNSQFRDILRSEIPPQTVQILNGINFIEGIERVIVSRSGPDLLVVLSGDFDLTRLKEMAVADGGSVKPYKKVQILLSSDADSQVGLVSNKIILLGGRDALMRAIDRPAGKSLGPWHDLWIIANSPSPEIERTSTAFDIEGDTVVLTADVTANTPETASRVIDNARLLNLAATQTDKNVHIVGRLGKDEIVRRAGQWRVTVEQFAAVRAPEKKAEPERGTIKIIGLDDGTREIPLGNDSKKK